MNIESLLDKIVQFEEIVIESGFKRDVQAYQTAITQPETQSNLVSLKEITNKLIESLEIIEESGLPEEMDILFPNVDVFTNLEHLEELKALNEDNEIDTRTYHNKLSSILTTLNAELNSDENRVKKLKEVFSVYSDEDKEHLSEEEKAILAIIFRDLETIKSLKKFAKALERWNKILLLYHQLVSSESPEDIKLLAIQNGSIEVIFDIDVKVAADLVEIFKIAMYMFSMYLAYKANLHTLLPINGTNKKLAELEKQRETILLDDIKNSVIKELKKQHKTRKETDSAIRSESLTVKYEQISSLVVDQIIKGNELRLLSSPDLVDEDLDNEDENLLTPAKELKEKSKEVRKLLKELNEADVKLLAEKYEIKDDVDDEIA